MKLVIVGAVVVDVEKLLFIERGSYRDDKKDWEAVLVMMGGVKCHPHIYIQEVLALLMDFPKLDGSGTRL